MKYPTCKCGYNGKPIEKMHRVIICGHCSRVFEYFPTSEYFNAKTKARLEEERAKANESVKRSYRIKEKK